MITVPTVGRKVWYRPTEEDLKKGDNGGSEGGRCWPLKQIGGQPLDATVVCVLNERLVHLSCRDSLGRQFTREYVQLVQEDDTVPLDKPYAEWMPYQKAQAIKHAPTDQPA